MARRFSTGSLGSQYKAPTTTTRKRVTKGRTYRPPTTTTVSKPKAPPTITSRRDEAIAPAVPTVTQPSVPQAWTATTAQMAMDAGLTGQSTLGITPGEKSPLTIQLEQMTKTQEKLFDFPTATAKEEILSPEILKGFKGTQTGTFGDYGLPPGETLGADFRNQMAIAMNQFTGGAGDMTPGEWDAAYPGTMAAPYISDPTQKVTAPAGFEYLQDWFDNPQLQGAAFNVMQTSTMMSEFGIAPTMVTNAVRVGMGWTRDAMEKMDYIQDPLGNWFLAEDDAPLITGDIGVGGDGGASTGGYGKGTLLGKGYPSTYGGGGANLINWRIRI